MSAPTKSKREQTLYKEPTAASVSAPEQEADAALLDRVVEETVKRMDAMASRYERELSDPILGQLKKAMMMAAAIERLRAMFTPPVMGLLKSLMNTPLGFMTDRGPSANKPPYHDDVVRDCAIEAMLKGFRWVGNEWNLIAGRMMGVQAGWKRKCEEIPAITDLKVTPGMPGLKDGIMGVRVAARWKINGIADQLIGTDGNPGRVFYIQQNSGSTTDNTIGKALRRAYKAVHEQATGTMATEPDEYPDGEESPRGGAGNGKSKSDKLADKLGAPPDEQSPPVRAPQLEEALRTELDAEVQRTGKTPREVEVLLDGYGVKRVEQLGAEQATMLLGQLKEMRDARQPGDGDE
jgi:hypothetical protein